ncbi:hyperosmotically inducible periplasmic protein [Pararobbsia alpina]|uniref:BON domain-containing protein n=1 Tax=Pararobbsia alpina TaxID=621374 RepID=UPI0039A68549
MLKNHLLAACCAATLALTVNTSFAQSNDGKMEMDSTTAVEQPLTIKQEKKAQRAANHALAKRVRVALDKTKGLDSSDITVLAKGGVVSLEGTVPDDKQIPLAESTTKSVSGVDSVTNYVRLAIKN